MNFRAIAAMVFLSVVGCSDSDGAGGAPAPSNGGATTGGATASGGNSSGTGGTTNSGGTTTSSGGIASTGGTTTSNGGTTSTGGIASTGGGGAIDGGGSSSGGTDAGGSGSELGEPLTVQADEQWHWVPFSDSHCANGSTAGIAVNFTTKSKNLAFIFQGGGVCWNEATCIQLPIAVNMDGLPADPLTDPLGVTVKAGVWNRTDGANPFRDWNYVFAPYCTGDGHLGNRTATYGSTKIQHVGFANTAAYLRRVVPTFQSAEKVLVTGSSAGGFAALGNYDQIATAFKAVGGALPILVDDAGPVLRAPHLPKAAQDAMREAWGTDETAFAGCAACKAENSAGWDFLAHKWPGMRGALVSSQQDAAVRVLYGLFAGGILPVGGTEFEAGLADFADWNASNQSTIAPSATHVFYYPGDRHMALMATDIGATPGLADFLNAQLSGSADWKDVRP